jgi:hypothetical protein
MALERSIASPSVMCSISHLPTNLAIDDGYSRKRVGSEDIAPKATVTEALLEYIQRRKQAKVLDLFGKIEFDPYYDYKKQRRRRAPIPASSFGP